MLDSDPAYKRARAGVQDKNLNDSVIAFLQAHDPRVGTLRDNLGNPLTRAISSRLGFVANSQAADAGDAKLLQSLYARRGDTLAQAGGAPNLGQSVSTGSLTNTANILKQNGQFITALKDAQQFVDKTLTAASNVVVKTVLQVDGTVKVLSDVLTADQITALTAKLNSSLAQQFQGQINDINVRLSKNEGKPVPPGSTTNAVFANKPESSSDGFYRKAP